MAGWTKQGGLQLLITYLLTPFIAYALYLGVERPSHRFAKILGTRAAKVGRWKLRFLPANGGS